MDRSKVCFKCNCIKQLDDFYAHPQMKDGRLNKCKECTKKDAHTHRENNIDKIREYDRNRSKLAHRISQNTEINRAWREEDKRRHRAHSAVRRAILNGVLVRQQCERCGNPKSVAHHEDYDKQLDVMWLCQPCHKDRHKEINLRREA